MIRRVVTLRSAVSLRGGFLLEHSPLIPWPVNISQSCFQGCGLKTPSVLLKTHCVCVSVFQESILRLQGIQHFNPYPFSWNDFSYIQCLFANINQVVVAWWPNGKAT